MLPGSKKSRHTRIHKRGNITRMLHDTTIPVEKERAGANHRARCTTRCTLSEHRVKDAGANTAFRVDAHPLPSSCPSACTGLPFTRLVFRPAHPHAFCLAVTHFFLLSTHASCRFLVHDKNRRIFNQSSSGQTANAVPLRFMSAAHAVHIRSTSASVMPSAQSFAGPAAHFLPPNTHQRLDSISRA